MPKKTKATLLTNCMRKKRITSILKHKAVKYPAAMALVFGLYLGGLQLFNNFHAVVPNELYRSAQISASEIEKYSKRYGIKTIINLRGENLGKDWYDEEVAAAKRNNIKHIDFRMSSKRELTKDRALKLIALMKNAQKPILLHCHSGADRTGLASALYLAAIKKESEFISELELSIIYGHFLFGARAMDSTFETLEPTLGYE